MYQVEAERQRAQDFFDWYYQEVSIYRKSKRFHLLDSAFRLFLNNRLLERVILMFLMNHGYETLEDKKLIDIGCGDGSRFRPFIEWGMPPHNISAMDISEEILRRTREYSPPGVNVFHGYADQVPVEDNSMDIVLNFGVIIHVIDDNMVQKIADEFFRILKPGGLLFLYFTTSDTCDYERTKIAHGSRTFTVDEIKDSYFKRFILLKTYRCFADDPLGLNWKGEPIFSHIGKVEDFLLDYNSPMHHTLMIFSK